MRARAAGGRRAADAATRSQRMITFTIDGREVQAPENTMLVDAAKLGDVEIPVFCYEPKLGKPVGACRMCLVEIEGMPKLQTALLDRRSRTAWSSTRRPSERATRSRRWSSSCSINHPLDCPVCDKGGECPLQDITFGWGGGISRFIEPKRHFRKPLELSPLDRDRPRALHPLLPLRALLAGDRRGLPARAARARRALLRRHLRRPPLRRAVQREHHRAVPGRRAHLASLPLPRPAVGHRGRRLDLHAVPGAVQRRPSRCATSACCACSRATTPSVDDGWLCDKGRFAYQAIHVDERITDAADARRRRAARGRPGSARSTRRPPALRRARGPRRRAGRRRREQRGGPAARRACCARGSARPTSTRAPAASIRAPCSALADPAARGRVPDLEFAHTVLVLGTEPLDDAPILDLRIRKGVRRNGVKLAIATARLVARRLIRKATVSRPLRAAARSSPCLARRCAASRSMTAAQATGDARAVRALAELLRDGGEDVVIVWGERLLRGDVPPRPGAAADRRRARHCAQPDGAGLLGIPPRQRPRPARGRRGSRTPDRASAEPTPRARRRPRDRALPGRRRAHARSTCCRSTRCCRYSGRGAVGARARPGEHGHRARLVPDRRPARARDRRLPGRDERREGGHDHPPRRARAAAAPGDRARRRDVRAEWSVLAELAQRVGFDLGVRTRPDGHGAARRRRFPSTTASRSRSSPGAACAGRSARPRRTGRRPPATAPRHAADAPKLPRRRRARRSRRAAALGTYRSMWAAPEVRRIAGAAFLHPRQRLEISPPDAERLGLKRGRALEVARPDVGEAGEEHLRMASTRWPTSCSRSSRCGRAPPAGRVP